MFFQEILLTHYTSMHFHHIITNYRGEMQLYVNFRYTLNCNGRLYRQQDHMRNPKSGLQV